MTTILVFYRDKLIIHNSNIPVTVRVQCLKIYISLIFVQNISEASIFPTIESKTPASEIHPTEFISEFHMLEQLCWKF